VRRAVLLLSIVLASCGKHDEKTASAPKTAETHDAPGSPASDGRILGHETYDLLDRAMSYRSSHRGRFPRSLRELGIDELTPQTARKYVVTGGQPQVTVSFRQPAGHSLLACSGTNSILDEATLSGGQFTLSCTVATGGTGLFKTNR